ncbi:MAG: hypothetical protein RLZ98_2528 [Pseudomonadota bacterium]|jgi:UbiD family decarboxylase
MDQVTVDTDSFRLRTFVNRLVEAGEMDVVSEPVALADLAVRWDCNPKAVLFKKAGPEGAELVANVNSSRSRLAKAFDTDEAGLLQAVMSRVATPQKLVEIPRGEAPVQEVVWTGADADFLKLPIPFQHHLDGGPYISATIDITVNPRTGLTNAGCRRIMVTGRNEAGVDVTAPSDLRAIYEGCVARGEKLPVSFVLGSHPTIHLAGAFRLPGDETELMARLRGAPMAVVKCVTNDLRVPADAEIILEGYFDEQGYRRDEGPYGEYMGYYGLMKMNPVFHLTAITMRKDALFQTSTISGRDLRNTDSGQLGFVRTEMVAWRALQSAIREPLAVYASTSQNLRLSMRQRVPGEARNAIACLFGCLGNLKNVYVFDEDIDIFDDRQVDWALGTRFQPDRDLIVEGGFRTVPIDPSLYGEKTGGKAGYDCTIKPDKKGTIEFTVSDIPTISDGPRFQSVEAALADGPKWFHELMSALGTKDPRAVIPELESLRAEGRLGRSGDGAYALKT